MDASSGLGSCGGRRGCGPDYVTSSLCTPPPGATRVGGEVRVGFPPPQRPPGTFLGRPVFGVSICCSAGRGLLVNGEHPHPSARRLVCARVCAGGGGCAVSPHSLEQELHQNQDLGDGPPSLVAKGRCISPSHIPNKFWRSLHPPKIYSAPNFFSPLVFLPRRPS